MLGPAGALNGNEMPVSCSSGGASGEWEPCRPIPRADAYCQRGTGEQFTPRDSQILALRAGAGALGDGTVDTAVLTYLYLRHHRPSLWFTQL